MTKFVPYLSDEAIERDAAALLAEYARARGVTIAPPIPIEDIVEKHLKLGIEFDDTHKLFGIPRDPQGNADILGAIFFDERRIVIDESLDPEENPAKEGRYRFTLAHEGGGHWRLHRHLFAKEPAQAALFGEDPVPSVVCRSSQAKEPVEWQADFYASCLLMPRKLVFETWCERFGTTAPFIFEINKSNPIFAPRRSNWIHISRAFESERDTHKKPDYQIVFNMIAREFAQVFCVSTEAMRIRLEKLGLLLREIPHQQTLAGVEKLFF
jgi:Zn-dependent peptidase ImmA (M78 family)